jgi:hypothetical protein
MSKTALRSGKPSSTLAPAPVAAKSVPPVGLSDLDRRRGPGRRRTDYRRAAEEGHMNEEQLEFIKAIDEYKRANGKPFPTWTEILDLVLYLGYRKVAPIGEFSLTKGRADAGRDDDGAEDGDAD